MRFVLGNRLMRVAGGTETHLMTLGDQLRRLGHDVVVYSPEPGPFAGHARQRGLEVLDELEQLPQECDVVLAQDRVVLSELLERYPRALIVFRICADRDHQLPPQVDGDVDLVVVLADRYADVARACAVTVPLLQLHVPVDTDRLRPKAAIRARPRRAVILGNYPDRIQVVREAWEGRGIKVGQVGGSHQRYDVTAALDGVDIVVAKSRAALDAMACGRAVYVYDMFGGDGWVTPESYAMMQADHFAGQATGRVIGVEELRRDLVDYDPGMGMANRDLVIQHHDARKHAIDFVAGVTAALEQKRSREGAGARSGRAGDAQTRLQQRLLRAERLVARLEAELDVMRESRGWRLVLRYRSWRDRLVRRGWLTRVGGRVRLRSVRGG